MTAEYKNTYKAPAADLSDLHADETWQEYDHNFVFEVKALQSDRVHLVPFVVSHQGSAAKDRVLMWLAIAALRAFAAGSP